MRDCQRSPLREPRPNMITGRSARASTAAARSTAPLPGRASTDRAFSRPRLLRRREPRDLRPFRLLVEALLLEAGVEADVDRRGRRRARGDVGAAHRLHQRLWGRRLVIPFDDRAYIGAL